MKKEFENNSVHDNKYIKTKIKTWKRQKHWYSDWNCDTFMTNQCLRKVVIVFAASLF